MDETGLHIRLGNPDNDVGLSEFIIIGGSTVGVYSITANADYFSYHLKITHFIAKNTSYGAIYSTGYPIKIRRTLKERRFAKCQ